MAVADFVVYLNGRYGVRPESAMISTLQYNRRDELANNTIMFYSATIGKVRTHRFKKKG